MKKWIYGAALVMGVGIGTGFLRVVNHSSSQGQEAVDSGSAVKGKSQRLPEAVGVRMSRMISAESTAMNENVPINQALEILFTEKKSPLRTRAFLRNRIQMMSRDQLMQALMNGDVRSEEELAEAGRRLGKDDPEEVFNAQSERKLQFHGMENTYRFMDALLQTWADADAPAILKRLKKMDRGGSQQEYSLRFSSYWAKIDPAAAARNFNDLIYLRNMQDFGDIVFSDQIYSEVIVNSWKLKDDAGMREYIGKLPNGRDKEAFEKALKKLDTPK